MSEKLISLSRKDAIYIYIILGSLEHFKAIEYVNSSAIYFIIEK